MPDPVSKAYDDRKSRIRHDLERHGVSDELAAKNSAGAMDSQRDPAGRKHVRAKTSGAGSRQGTPWPERPPPAG